MAGPVYPYRDRRFDHEEWPSIERSELRAANHHVLYGGAMVISSYPFVITRAVFDPDFDMSDLRARDAKRKAESAWPGPMYAAPVETQEVTKHIEFVHGRPRIKK